MSAEEELEQLRAEMETELDADLAFFPTRWDVKGYYGTGDVVFVAYKPSTGTFPSRHDRLMYGTLVTYALEDAHITDVSKERGEGGQEITPPERQRNLPYFERELEIVQPNLLVALGEKAENELDWMDAADDYETMRVNHYTWARRWGNEETFLNQMKQVYQKARELREG